MQTIPSRTNACFVVLFSLLSFLLTACVSAQQKRPTRELPGSALSLLSAAPPVYGAPMLPNVPGDAGSAAGKARLHALMNGAPAHEPALDLAAAVLARTYAEQQQVPADSVMHWLLWRCGAVSSPIVSDVFGVIGEEAGPHFEERLRQIVQRVPPGVSSLSFGLARVEWQGVVVQGVIVAHRTVALEPLAKVYAPGSTFTLRARLLAGYGEPTIFADAGGSEVRVVPITPGEGGTITASFQLPATPGRYFVELVATEPRERALDPEYPWRHTLLWVPVYVGVPEPVAIDAFMRRPAPNPSDVIAAKMQIFAAYNAERARLGMKALVPDERASTLAQQRSEEVARAGGKPRPDREAATRLASAGIPPRRFLDSLDAVEYLSEYVTLRLLQPAARHHLLSPSTEILAVGLALRSVGDTPIAIVVTEYAIEPTPPLDAKKELTRIHGLLDKLEAAEGRPALTRDDAIAKHAQDVADEVCRGARKQEDVALVWDRAAVPAKPYRQRGLFSWSGFNIDDDAVARVHAKMKGRGYTRAAIGICQGKIEQRAGVTYMLLLQLGP